MLVFSDLIQIEMSVPFNKNLYACVLSFKRAESLEGHSYRKYLMNRARGTENKEDPY